MPGSESEETGSYGAVLQTGAWVKSRRLAQRAWHGGFGGTSTKLFASLLATGSFTAPPLPHLSSALAMWFVLPGLQTLIVIACGWFLAQFKLMGQEVPQVGHAADGMLSVGLSP